ncbi:hypothetical protein [Pseudoduganella umbonata]|uniref:DUF805 domain-containing protein n=1 Tax=Pseudoduganella umbonata TaxID=864828 RepID=A0A4P8HQF6_9BURK|nr:hypothetical protein [Pseudoduganella umbonata]MBB3222727.1 hypothetical protein [Pseudoduganella umbonata]QCP10778.1 hypothetical protein FCL38_10300 [Pseudoduganella umbonata]
MGSYNVFHSAFTVIFFLFWIAVFTIPMWRIAVKAGYPGFASLLMYIPLLNIVVLWMFAFMKWPVERNAQ